jgi:small-conductance mechanosensitive channel
MSFELPRRLESLKKLVFWPILLGLLLAVVPPVFAQGDQTAAPSQMPTPAPNPIPASQIPARTGEVAALLRGMEAGAQPRKKSADIGDALPATEESIDSLEEEVLPLFESDGPAQVFTDVDAGLVRLERELTGWLDTLNHRTVELDGDLADLRSRKVLWEITRNEADAAELPAALVQQVRETITAIRNTEKVIGDRRAELLTLQAEVAEQRSRSRALSDRIDREVEDRQQDLLRLDSPPLWKAFGESQGDDLGEQMLDAIQRNLNVLRKFVRENARGLVRDGVIFILVLILFIRLGRKARLWVQSDESLRTTAALMQRPVSASMLVTIILFGSFYQTTAPVAAMNLLGVVLLLIMLRLLPFLVRPGMRPAIGLLVGLIALYLLADLVPTTFLLNRMAELLLAVLGAAASGWALRTERSLRGTERDFWNWAALWVTGIATVFFCLSAAANVIGAVAFGSLLAMATLASIYDAITLWIFVVVLFGAITVALRTTTARRLLVIRHHSDRIQTAVFRLIKLVTFVSWLGFALYHFGVLDWTTTTLKEIFFFEYSLGEFSISVSSVGIFIVVIWLSIKLSQLIRFVLDEDVLTRLDLPKGVPSTISKTSTYLVVSIGCVIAVAAAGLDLSRATILVGALGVGIGFGLQNAVNNFVSGLILLFGRPINVGDKIEIGNVSGVVKDIGIRATVVQTWQGAEVIVPNATLISDNLINWTLSDDRRRMEIPVGVAYGSPTEKVIELLTEVARAHDEVLEDPEPKTIFTGFGDSSLDFELRAWTVGNFVNTASDLRVGMDQTLAENEIEIPFPQRDLHVRSMDTRAAERLAEGVAMISTEVEDDESSMPPEPLADKDADEETS